MLPCAGQKILSQRWTFLPGASWNLVVDNIHEIDILADLIGRSQCTDLFDPEFDRRLSGARHQARDSFRRAYVDLRNNLGFAANTGNLSHI